MSVTELPRKVGTTVKTTQGPMIEGVLIAWSRVPMLPVPLHSRARDREPSAGFSIVLLENGDVALCATGDRWSEIYARSAVGRGVDPLAAFEDLRTQTGLVDTMVRAACFDLVQIRDLLTSLWGKLKDPRHGKD
jgi:hypothetical protein